MWNLPDAKASKLSGFLRDPPEFHPIIDMWSMFTFGRRMRGSWKSGTMSAASHFLNPAAGTLVNSVTPPGPGGYQQEFQSTPPPGGREGSTIRAGLGATDSSRGGRGTAFG